MGGQYMPLVSYKVRASRGSLISTRENCSRNLRWDFRRDLLGGSQKRSLGNDI